MKAWHTLTNLFARHTAPVQNPYIALNDDALLEALTNRIACRKNPRAFSDFCQTPHDPRIAQMLGVMQQRLTADQTAHLSLIPIARILIAVPLDDLSDHDKVADALWTQALRARHERKNPWKQCIPA